MPYDINQLPETERAALNRAIVESGMMGQEYDSAAHSGYDPKEGELYLDPQQRGKIVGAFYEKK
jgi:hypothetical protein